jgi:hypothetical protein
MAFRCDAIALGYQRLNPVLALATEADRHGECRVPKAGVEIVVNFAIEPLQIGALELLGPCHVQFSLAIR